MLLGPGLAGGDVPPPITSPHPTLELPPYAVRPELVLDEKARAARSIYPGCDFWDVKAPSWPANKVKPDNASMKAEVKRRNPYAKPDSWNAVELCKRLHELPLPEGEAPQATLTAPLIADPPAITTATGDGAAAACHPPRDSWQHVTNMPHHQRGGLTPAQPQVQTQTRPAAAGGTAPPAPAPATRPVGAAAAPTTAAQAAANAARKMRWKQTHHFIRYAAAAQPPTQPPTLQPTHPPTHPSTHPTTVHLLTHPLTSTITPTYTPYHPPTHPPPSTHHPSTPHATRYACALQCTCMHMVSPFVGAVSSVPFRGLVGDGSVCSIRSVRSVPSVRSVRFGRFGRFGQVTLVVWLP